jgi:opacity protein-like surface antigen
MPRPISLPLSLCLRRCALSVLLCLLSAAALRGQTTSPTAARAADLQVGAGLTVARHDYEFAPPEDGTYISGATVYATYDFRPHLGVEFNFRQLSSHDADHMYERSYEIGPRYVWHLRRFNPYVRVSYGRGVFNFPGDVANLAYNMFAAGGGVDVNVLKHLNARVDFDYQDWLKFPGTTVRPSVGTVGVAYHF